jgi:hypothetical protein
MAYGICRNTVSGIAGNRHSVGDIAGVNVSVVGLIPILLYPR